MARSQYIYLLRYLLPGSPSDKEVLATFTVKYEAKQWAKLCQHPLTHLRLSRMRDGLTYHKAEEIIPWTDEELQEAAADRSPKLRRSPAPEASAAPQALRH